MKTLALVSTSSRRTTAPPMKPAPRLQHSRKELADKSFRNSVKQFGQPPQPDDFLQLAVVLKKSPFGPDASVLNQIQPLMRRRAVKQRITGASGLGWVVGGANRLYRSCLI